MFSLSELNDQQKTAAQTIKGPVLILAGAGSGKTKTITYRIANMLLNHNIDPRSILGVTFTNKAATEMRERVMSLVSLEKAKGITLSTFHSLGVQILKKEITKLGYQNNFTIYDTSDQMAILREGARHFKDNKNFDLKIILSKISFLKNNGVEPVEFGDSKFFDPESAYDHATHYCYQFYQDKLKFCNAIDFDDILFLTLKLFVKYPEVAKNYSQRFKYIMIDEYQDTNTLQFNIVLNLTTTHNNLCVVGDDDQSIYMFRGADVTNILNFEKNYPDAKVIKLEQNYRSTKEILDLANIVIKANKTRRDKELWSTKVTNKKPLLWAMADSLHESQVVIEDIVNLKKNGEKLKDIAILYRSNNQAPAIEDQLRINNIPYKMIGGQKFYDKKEVKDLIAYMQLIANPFSDQALRRIINVPARGIGLATLEKYLELQKENKKSLFLNMEQNPSIDPKKRELIQTFTRLIRKYSAIIKPGNLTSGIEALIEEIGFYNYIAKEYSGNLKQAEIKKFDVMHFIAAASRFESQFKSEATLSNFLEMVLLMDSQDNPDEDEAKEKTNEVVMMTLHSSKGLEFKNVYLIGVEEEILPHKRTIIEDLDIDEECRLCYVGITRAKERLIMTYCKERTLYGKQIPRYPSRFIEPQGARAFYIEQDRTKFGHMSKEEAQNYRQNFFGNLLADLDKE